MITVASVTKKSPADIAGVRHGDKLMAVNGTEINDCIDLSYASSDSHLEFTIIRNSKELKLSSVNKKMENSGIIEEQFRIKRCNNRCIFCFVDQMPKGLRPTLYIKDEDYRLSFLDGSYICATNLSSADFKRIEEMRLSPLYISVHATDENVRKKLLNNPKAPSILSIIDKLAASSIQLHTQIVLCPGYNDGITLDKTISELSARHPDILSIAIVPVGLTQHRDSLHRLNPLTKPEAKRLIEKVSGIQLSLRKKHGRNFLYIADEIYIRANHKLPPQRHYGDFHQYENGVGMMRDFITSFTSTLVNSKSNKGRKTERFKGVAKNALVLTAKSPYKYIDKLFTKLSRKTGNKYRTVAVTNTLLGETITVSGLLSGRDLICTARLHAKNGDIVFIPPNCLNSDGLTLDNMTTDEISGVIGCTVVAPDNLQELLLK